MSVKWAVLTGLLAMALQLFIAGQWVGDLRADVSNIKERLQRIETTIDQWRR